MNKIISILVLFSALFLHADNNPKFEMRGVWIAVVKNIDWPSSNTASPEQQKIELISILDQLKKNNINAVFFQVRTECDAVYFSEIEPYTQWALKGDFDPLEFLTEEAHKRGMELHAWFNPFRSVFDVEDNNLPANHISKTKPEWNIKYGKQKWLNPGLPEVRNYIVSVIEDVVKRYDLDGVHFDDYFYPYPQKTNKFNDDKAYKKYSLKNQSKDEWRRGNINSLVKSVSEKIKEIKPGIRFGISPFGIWRNKFNDNEGSITSGSESYSTVYADSKTWLKEGWIDYIAPQIYWNLNHPAASYTELIKWWNDNSYGRDVYAGMSVYKIAGNDKKYPEWDSISHFIKQIELNRSLPNIKGSIFFNTSSFLKNPLGLTDSLSGNYFKDYTYASSNGLKYRTIEKHETNNQAAGFSIINTALFNVLKKSNGIYKLLLNVPEDGNVKLALFSNSGKELKNITSGYRQKGHYELHLDTGASSGNCFIIMETGKYVNTCKIKL